MKLKKELYTGNLYKCTSMPTTMSNYFIGYDYDEKLISKDLVFIKLTDNKYVEYNNYKAYGRKAIKCSTEAESKGDYFVKDLKPLYIINSKFVNEKFKTDDVNMAKIKKFCFVNLTMETANEIKNLINDLYVLNEMPQKPELKYTRFDGSVKIIKLSKCPKKITQEKMLECIEAFEVFLKGEDDRIRDEVGKLVAITGATLSGREEQLFILRQTFAAKNQNNDKEK